MLNDREATKNIRYIQMTSFSEELAKLSAAPSLDVEGENTVSEESNKRVGENRSESIRKKGDT